MNTVDREQEKNRINKLIEECCLGLLDEVFFDSKLKELADALREHFDSDYCAIGKVDGEFLEDRVVSKSVSPKLENQNKFQGHSRLSFSSIGEKILRLKSSIQV